MSPPSPRARAGAAGRNARRRSRTQKRDRSGVSWGVRRWGARRARDAELASRCAPPRSFLLSLGAVPLRLAVAPLLLLLAGCISVDVPFGRPGPLEELVVHGERGPKILLLDVQGV